MKLMQKGLFALVFVMASILGSTAFALNSDNITVTQAGGANAAIVQNLTRVTQAAQNSTNPASGSNVAIYSAFNVSLRIDTNITNVHYNLPDSECLNNTAYNVYLYNNSLTPLTGSLVANQTASNDSDSDGIFDTNLSFTMPAVGNATYNFTLLYYCESIDTDKSEVYTDSTASGTTTTTATVTYTPLTNVTYSNVAVLYQPRVWASRSKVSSVLWNDSSVPSNEAAYGVNITDRNFTKSVNASKLYVSYEREGGATSSSSSRRTTTVATPQTTSQPRADAFSVFSQRIQQFFANIARLFGFGR